MFEEILQGRYANWHGVIPQPTLEELTSELGASVVHPSRERIRIATRYAVVKFERPSQPSKWEAWIPAGAEEVFILECEDPVCSEVVLDALGKPEIVLTDRRLAVGYLVAEHVFSQRGIVLSVGTAILPSDGQALLHVRLFPPMSLQRYLTDVGEPNPALPNTNT